MSIRLSTQNVGDYLAAAGLCAEEEKAHLRMQSMPAKNFNLQISLTSGDKLLIKQERYNGQGKTAGEFQNEWKIQEFLKHFEDLNKLQNWVPPALHYDAEQSIIVFPYLDGYQNVFEYYSNENEFPVEVAYAIGALIAKFHRLTFNSSDYQRFFEKHDDQKVIVRMTDVASQLERLGPEIFGTAPEDGLRFFMLYQRYESLAQAIKKLAAAFTPCCLMHNDLKLNNILLRNDWRQGSAIELRLIDWERATWGDPAHDLGTLISGYLRIWLDNLIVSSSLSIEESIQLAAIPLVQLQPSIAVLVQAYLTVFSEILEQQPDFLMRVLQCIGLALIQQILANIQYKKIFCNTDIAMLQVAKTLLCSPHQATATIFGSTRSN